jgi:hypothetical protein
MFGKFTVRSYCQVYTLMLMADHSTNVGGRTLWTIIGFLDGPSSYDTDCPMAGASEGPIAGPETASNIIGSPLRRARNVTATGAMGSMVMITMVVRLRYRHRRKLVAAGPLSRPLDRASSRL